jgi:hypothetical protein
LVFLVDGADDLVLVDDFVVVVVLDVAGGDGAFFLDDDGEETWLLALAVVAEFDLLEVQNDLDDVFEHAGRVENSCSTPRIFTEVMAAPSKEESRTRRRELPMVWP